MVVNYLAHKSIGSGLVRLLFREVGLETICSCDMAFSYFEEVFSDSFSIDDRIYLSFPENSVINLKIVDY